MALTDVEVTSEVWMMCVTHALSTEKEEIMGLLLGDVLVYGDGRATARIFSAAPQTRSDRRKDRVETNPEQLAAAAAEAEKLSLLSGRETRVIGWYHSHPHITVFPSHVDVATQGMYQMLDQGFVGLIFSCFSEDDTKVGRIQVTAFQSAPANRRSPTPIPVRPAYSRSPSPSPFAQSPMPGTSAVPPPIGEQIPLPRAAAPAPATSDTSIEEILPAAGAGPSRIRGGGPSDAEEQDPSTSRRPPRPPSLEVDPGALPSGGRSTRNSPSPYYPSDGQRKGWSYAQAAGPRRESSQDSMASAMEEAAARSMEDNRGANFVHKEVPLRVISGLDVVGASPELLLDPLVSLQRILFAEEKAAYRQALAQSSVDGKMHPIAAIHHAATYQASLCKLMEYCLSPVLAALWERQHQCQLQLEFLQQEERDLRDAAATVAAAAEASPPKLQRPSSVRTRPGEPVATQRVPDLLSGAPTELLGGAGYGWKGRVSEELGSGSGYVSKPVEGAAAASARLDAAGEGVMERTREARARGSAGVVDGQEKDRPIVHWD